MIELDTYLLFVNIRRPIYYACFGTSDGKIRWMNVTSYLSKRTLSAATQIVFDGETFSVSSVLNLKNTI